MPDDPPPPSAAAVERALKMQAGTVLARQVLHLRSMLAEFWSAFGPVAMVTTTQIRERLDGADSATDTPREDRTRILADLAPVLSDALDNIRAAVGMPADTSEPWMVVDAVRALVADTPREDDADELLIVRRPGRMSGRPTIGHSRLPLTTILEYLRAGDSVELVTNAYPSVTAEQVRVVAALRDDLDDRDADRHPREDDTLPAGVPELQRCECGRAIPCRHCDTPREDDTPAPAPQPPAGSEHYQEGWRNGYEQAGIDRRRAAEDGGSVSTTPTQPTWPGTLDEDDSLVADLDRALVSIQRVRTAIDEGGIRCGRGHYTAHDDVVGDPNSPRWRCSHCVRVEHDTAAGSVSTTPADDPADEPCRADEGMTGIRCMLDEGHPLPHRGWWRHENDATGESAVYIEWPVPERVSGIRVVPKSGPVSTTPDPATLAAKLDHAIVRANVRFVRAALADTTETDTEEA